MRPRVLAVFLPVVCFAAFACARPAAEPARRVVIHTSATTASDLKDAISRLPEMSLEAVTPGGSSVTSLEDIQRGTTDIGIAMADVAYLAFAGQLDERSGTFDQLRGMALLNMNSLHLLVAPKSTVRGINDLRGRHVALGPVGSATALLAEVLLKAYAIDPSSVRAERLPYPVTADMLATGEVDAAFMTQTPPSQPVLSATERGARLLDVGGPQVERLRGEHPFLRRTLIPADTYPHQTKAIHTVGVDLVLLCRATMDEDVVYRLLDAYFATRPGSTPAADFDRAPATPVPLHAGAARYYRQREIER